MFLDVVADAAQIRPANLLLRPPLQESAELEPLGVGVEPAGDDGEELVARIGDVAAGGGDVVVHLLHAFEGHRGESARAAGRDDSRVAEAGDCADQRVAREAVLLAAPLELELRQLASLDEHTPCKMR